MAANEMVSLVLAGGKGTRLEGLTKRPQNLQSILEENIVLSTLFYPI